MVKVNGKTADFSLQIAGAQKTMESREASGDFRKLLQGKQNSTAEDSKGSTDVKEDTKPTENKETSVEGMEDEKTQTDDVQAEGLLTAYQIGQELRPELIQLAPKTTAETEETASTMTEELPVGATESAEIPGKSALPITEEGKSSVLTIGATVQTVGKAEAKDMMPVKESAGLELQGVAVEEIKPEQSAEQNPAQQNTEQESTAREQAQPDDGMMQQIAATQIQQPATQGVQREVFPEENVAPVQVSQPEELPEKVTDQILAKVNEGVTEFEIHIEPENLGKIAVKILYQAGQATVSILCSEKRALDVLGNNAREIGNVLQRNLGGETTIIVEKQETDYLHQNREDNQQSQQDAQQQQKKEQNQKQNAEDAEQFLQRLRLGLMG